MASRLLKPSTVADTNCDRREEQMESDFCLQARREWDERHIGPTPSAWTIWPRTLPGRMRAISECA